MDRAATPSDAVSAVPLFELENLSRWCIALGERVPAKVDLVYHLCYGSAQNRH